MYPGRLGVSGAAEFARSSKCNAINFSKPGFLRFTPGFSMDLGHVPFPILLIGKGAAAQATVSFQDLEERFFLILGRYHRLLQD